MHSSNHIVKFADDTTVVSLISKNDESAYREEVQRLTAWCKANSLSLNVDKTKEMVVGLRRAQSDHSPLFIDGSPVEIVKSPKFLGVHLAENFTWSHNTTSISMKAQQRLYFLRRLRKAHLPPPILTMFYRGTIESVLSSCKTAWFGNCTVSDCKTLQRIVRTAEKIIGVFLPSITDMYTTRCIRKANSIVDDPTHPSHTLFTLLPSGKSPSASAAKEVTCSDDENTAETLGKRNLTYLATNDDEFDGCISTTVLAIIRAVTGELLDRIIDKDLKDNCNGCAINHPSQLQHACLFDPEQYYLHMNSYSLMKKLFKPWLKYTVARGLKMCGITHTPSLEKIQGIAEATVCDWKDEPFIKTVLSEAREEAKEICSDQMYEDVVDYWTFHSSLEPRDPPHTWETSKCANSVLTPRKT
ncbi:hypothetical protein QTP86_002920 [Hemibagrus guttatus]|nr:hypothetical protein QTP86_002920 [Hemibagrus guttatus]